MKNLSSNIKKLRTRDGKSQAELAQEIGCTTKLISDWEQGRRQPSLEKLLKLVDIFDVTLDQLVKHRLELALV